MLFCVLDPDLLLLAVGSLYCAQLPGAKVLLVGEEDGTAGLEVTHL